MTNKKFIPQRTHELPNSITTVKQVRRNLSGISRGMGWEMEKHDQNEMIYQYLKNWSNALEQIIDSPFLKVLEIPEND